MIAEHLPIQADDRFQQIVWDRPGISKFACVVCGAGVRMTAKYAPGLEGVVNAVREGAPHTDPFQRKPGQQRRCCGPVVAVRTG